MRPEHFHSGNAPVSWHDGYGYDVSMRPEHFHSGNYPFVVILFTTFSVSMRPEHFHSGNPANCWAFIDNISPFQ